MITHEYTEHGPVWQLKLDGVTVELTATVGNYEILDNINKQSAS